LVNLGHVTVQPIMGLKFMSSFAPRQKLLYKTRSGPPENDKILNAQLILKRLRQQLKQVLMTG